MHQTPEISIVISTYNRAPRLAGALAALLAQQAPGLPYEIIAVDNNSTDDTRQVIERFQRDLQRQGHTDRELRYVFEGQQGVSYGRNAGLRVARAPLLAFTDDDMRMAPDWVRQLKQCFDAHPNYGYLGGRVLPQWLCEPPAWLTPRHWAPVALLDYGQTPQPIDGEHERVLITANFAIRRAVLESIGGFSPLAQRTRNDTCSTEDQELLLRLWAAGERGAYFPQLLGRAEVPPLRLTKRYHRRWHQGHGRCLALMHDARLERTTRGYWLGVPAHLYRQMLEHALRWVKHRRRGEGAEAFWCETRLWFGLGFCIQRYRDYVAKSLGGRESGKQGGWKSEESRSLSV
jgi:glucosyl-dolichyl phosphate glucuronosyltransferase